MKCRAIIFDYDGVIVDSEKWFVNTFVTSLEHFGIHADAADANKYMGKPVVELVNALIQDYGLQASREDFEKIYFQTYMYWQQRTHDPMPGLVPFLKWITRKQIMTGLATSAVPSHYETINNRIGLHFQFDVYVCAKDIMHSKPDPEIYEKAIKAFSEKGISKDEIAVIEDSANGIASARAAGLFVFGYKGSKVQQDTSKANIEVGCFKEIQNILEGEIEK